MNKLFYSYHNHTFRCGHAKECDDEEYVINAVKYGIKEYGFTDHIFLPGIVHPYMRGTYEMLDGYINSVLNLKDKYKDKLNIRLGFEAEYMSEFVDYYKELLTSKKIEYLILAQHTTYDKNGKPLWYVAYEDIKYALKKYTEDIIEGMNTGLFKFVAHPDLFVLFYPSWDNLVIECSNKIISAAIKNNLPLEINLCKFRALANNEIRLKSDVYYPALNFWKLVAKTKAKVIIGVDAHFPEHVLDPKLETVEKLIKESGIKVDWNYKI